MSSAAIDFYSECENCGDVREDVRGRMNDSVVCDACWADALAYGHLHGLHSEGGEALQIAECPSCAGNVPACYR